MTASPRPPAARTLAALRLRLLASVSAFATTATGQPRLAHRRGRAAGYGRAVGND